MADTIQRAIRALSETLSRASFAFSTDLDISIVSNAAPVANVAKKAIMLSNIDVPDVPGRQNDEMYEKKGMQIRKDCDQDLEESLARAKIRGEIDETKLQMIQSMSKTLENNMYNVDQQRHPQAPHVMRDNTGKLQSTSGTSSAAYLFRKPNFADGSSVQELILAIEITADAYMHSAYERLAAEGKGFLHAPALFANTPNLLGQTGPGLYRLSFGGDLNEVGYSTELQRRRGEHLNQASKGEGVNKHVRGLNQAGFPVAVEPFHPFAADTTVLEMIELESLTIVNLGSAMDRERLEGLPSRMQDKLFDSPSWFGTSGIISTPPFVRAVLMRYRVVMYNAAQGGSRNLPPFRFALKARFSDRYTSHWRQILGSLAAPIEAAGYTICGYLRKLGAGGTAYKTLCRMLDEEYGEVNPAAFNHIARSCFIGRNHNEDREVQSAILSVSEDTKTKVRPKRWTRTSYTVAEGM